MPVTDVDRAKAFYVDEVGFHANHDHQVNKALRFVQLTPPGSACPIVTGTGVTDMAPGSQKGVQVVVADVESARQQLLRMASRPAMCRTAAGSFVTFSDPDGNTSSLRRLPGGDSSLDRRGAGTAAGVTLLGTLPQITRHRSWQQHDRRSSRGRRS